eukprot:scaffold379_cov235-Pinguiococcus_pyrenoidosus.AAC.6
MERGWGGVGWGGELGGPRQVPTVAQGYMNDDVVSARPFLLPFRPTGVPPAVSCHSRKRSDGFAANPHRVRKDSDALGKRMRFTCLLERKSQNLKAF